MTAIIPDTIIDTNSNIYHSVSPTLISNSCDTLFYTILVAVKIIVTELKSK